MLEFKKQNLFQTEYNFIFSLIYIFQEKNSEEKQFKLYFTTPNHR